MTNARVSIWDLNADDIEPGMRFDVYRDGVATGEQLVVGEREETPSALSISI